MLKTLSFLLEYLFIRFLYLTFAVLPYRLGIPWGIIISRTIFLFARSTKEIALINIRHAFPHWTISECRRLLRKHIDHLGITLAVSLYSPRVNEDWIQKYLEYEDFASQIESQMLKADTGVTIISGHIGNWEIMAAYMPMRLPKTGTVYKPARNPKVSEWYDKNFRTKRNVLTIPVHKVNQILRELKNGYWLAFFSDQNAGKSGIFVDFLNRPASTFAGPVLMSYLSQTPILFYTTIYSGRGKFKVQIQDLGIPELDGFANREEMIHFHTQKWSQTLEREIQKYPEQYFWVHNRWKTQPGDFPRKRIET